MRVLVTGADGFLGKNLIAKLNEANDIEVIPFTRNHFLADIEDALKNGLDCVFHLAGVNRPENNIEFEVDNVSLTREICNAILRSKAPCHVIYSSSRQAAFNTPYGNSKKMGEECLKKLAENEGIGATIFRLPGVFGKWARPHYNSVVATFCHQIAQGLPIEIHDENKVIELAYIDDVIESFLSVMSKKSNVFSVCDDIPTYDISLGDLGSSISGFAASRDSLVIPAVGHGLERALYATYLSYLPVDKFSYKIPFHNDPRGSFVEFLKTPEHGQFSVFTAGVGVTRGEHYHHTKSEKFLVLQGTAQFGYREIVTGQRFKKIISGGDWEVIESIPGWAHNVVNIGSEPLVVMLWANEIFDAEKPDTIGARVDG